MNVHRSGVIAFGATPTYLTQVENISFDPGIENAINTGATVDTIFAGALQSMPMLTFESRALGTALGIIGFAGAVIDPVVVYLPKLASGGTLASGSVHTTITLDNCACYLQSITASQGSEATASFVVLPTYDGSNAPVAVATTVALPTVTQTATKFTLGPLEIGTTLYNLQDLTFNSGIDPIRIATRGEVWPRFNGIAQRRPNFTLSTHDVSLLDTIASDASHQPLGKASANTVNIYFRGLTNRGAPQADTAAKHLKIAMTQVFVQPGEVSAANDGAATLSLTGHAVYDGTNAIAAVTADATITEA